MINKDHAKFSEYIKKAEKIREQMKKELDEIEPSYGFDGESTSVCKKYAKKVKELQKDYSFLFEED